MSPTCYLSSKITQYLFNIVLVSFWIYQHISILNVIITEWFKRASFSFKTILNIEDIFSWMTHSKRREKAMFHATRFEIGLTKLSQKIKNTSFLRNCSISCNTTFLYQNLMGNSKKKKNANFQVFYKFFYDHA